MSETKRIIVGYCKAVGTLVLSILYISAWVIVITKKLFGGF